MFRGTKAGLCTLVAAVAIAGCGGDDAGDSPDTDGGLTAAELAEKLPEAEFAQATAADVLAAKEAAGLEADVDPLELSTTNEEVRFAFSTFYAFRSISALVDNPVREALDYSQVTAYAAHPFLADDAVTLVSTSQDFEEIATSLEEADWTRDGNVLSIDGNPEELTYTAVGAGDGFVVLGYDAEVVEAVASGDAAPSETGELELLAGLGEAPVTFAAIPAEKGFETGVVIECIDTLTFTDPVDGTSAIEIGVAGADEKNLPPDFEEVATSAGFTVESVVAEGDVITIEALGRDDEGFANSPALLLLALTDEEGDPLYDCG